MEKTMRKKSFNIMVFPAGPVCNLNCDYCYYLDKTELYPETDDFQMSEELLELFIKQYIESQPGPNINFGWQGGEPTIRGLDFFEKAIELEKKYLPEGWNYENSFQTNGLLIDEEWARFLGENNFLVGLSIDGPEDLHDFYRKDKQGKNSHSRVLAGLDLLKKYQVPFNILCVVNKQNVQKPLQVYNFFKELGAEHIQFIPIVETEKAGEVSDRSVSPGEYGKFLIDVFNEWVLNDVAKIFVQIFEQCAAAWSGYRPGLCIFTRTCGKAAIMEHNGDIYSCDHFVFPENKLGNIKKTHIADLMNEQKQIKFGNDKANLPSRCEECDYLFICQGGCPKNRIVQPGKGEEDTKINYLCQDYKRFYSYIDPFLQELAVRIKQNQHPNTFAMHLKKVYQTIWENAGRNEPCPCGSGKKFKKCCLSRV